MSAVAKRAETTRTMYKLQVCLTLVILVSTCGRAQLQTGFNGLQLSFASPGYQHVQTVPAPSGSAAGFSAPTFNSLFSSQQALQQAAAYEVPQQPHQISPQQALQDTYHQQLLAFQQAQLQSVLGSQQPQAFRQAATPQDQVQAQAVAPQPAPAQQPTTVNTAVNQLQSVPAAAIKFSSANEVSKLRFIGHGFNISY